MPWRRIEEAHRDGRRVVVSGGTYVMGSYVVCQQMFPAMVSWDGSDWLICDNTGERAVIRDPHWWMDVWSEPAE